MEKKLRFKEYLYVGSMLFGLFFGAGNLIFPVHMGQLAGSEVSSANLGFLITGIGMPFLGVVAMGISNSTSVYELSSRVNKKYAKFFTILLYLVIGPFFALPRLATTSYEIGIAPHISEGQETLALAGFSILFFILAWFFSRNPSRLIDYVGKILNPTFLLLLGILLFLALINPIASVNEIAPHATYQEQAFSNGFLEGYNTLDALAALAFGVVIISTLKDMGVKEPKSIALDTIKSGSLSVIAMGVIYTLLAYMGAQSMGQFDLSENGGIALAQLSRYYLGHYGSILLALIVISACLKTAIGLVTSFGETFTEMFPNRSYGFFIIVASLLPAIFANVGLTNIIELSVPVLMFIYPLAIVLIILTLVNPLFKGYQVVYQWTTVFTMIVAFIDGLNASGLKDNGLIKSIIEVAEKFLPLFSYGMGWILPAILGLVVGYLIAVLRPKNSQVQFDNNIR